MKSLQVGILGTGVLLALTSLSTAQVASADAKGAPAEAKVTGPIVRETLVHEKTTAVEVELNDRTVLCSAADYQAEMLKIVIPQLADLTLLNHRNTNAGGPCVSAGICRPAGSEAGLEPGDILKPGLPEVESIPVTVKLTRVTSISSDQSGCDVSLKEEIHLVVRGIPFYHVRWHFLDARVGSDCR